MKRYAIAIFTGAFLVFQVQPIIARYILPWFGGTPAVWSACLLFFQLGVLIGYAYAHLIAKKLSIQRQAILHCSLILVAFVLLPISPVRPNADLSGMHETSQIWAILKFLFKNVGFHFILLSASAPLLQRWFADEHPGTSPYRLYALSNAGSLLALLTYPFLIEPSLALNQQTLYWSIGFGFFGIAAFVSARAHLIMTKSGTELSDANGPPSVSIKKTYNASHKASWVLFSAIGSILLLAVTNYMSQDLAAIPFLWIIPLSLYLISFIVCFERDAWYNRLIWMPLFAIFTVLLVQHLQQDFNRQSRLLNDLLIYCGTLFTGVMVCHGELTLIKPKAIKLTGFYLYLALGGAIGGAFVNLLAPVMFSGYWELHVSLVCIALIIVLTLFRGKTITSKTIRLAVSSAAAIASIWLATSLLKHVDSYQNRSIHASRGFFGVLHVFEYDAGIRSHYRSMFHGRVRHGDQWMTPEFESQPTTYYTSNSGVGIAIRHHPLRKAGKSLNIGVIGLGVGTVSALCAPDDKIRYYEINGQVVALAKDYFTFLQKSKPKEEIILGDARLELEAELKNERSNQFDVLVMDAFSGDGIPIHLLTEQSFELYERHLKRDGILAIHITNLYVDLSDVIRNLAKMGDMSALYIVHDGEDGFYDAYSEWILVTQNSRFLAEPKVQSAVSKWDHQLRDIRWTDDFSNLFETVIW